LKIYSAAHREPVLPAVFRRTMSGGRAPATPMIPPHSHHRWRGEIDGEAPKAAKIDMSQIRVKARTRLKRDGQRRPPFQCVVYVKDGLGTARSTCPKKPYPQSKRLQIHPHVLGVVAGQTIKIINSDPTTHNIHPTPKTTRVERVTGLLRRPARENLAREEIMLPVKCNQHPWMRMSST